MRSRFWLAFAFLIIFALGFYIFRRETTPRQEIFYRRGLDFARTGRYDLALEELQKVILYDPHYAPAYNNIGVIYWKMGRKKDAIAALEKAVALDPVFPAAHYNLGKLYMDLSMDERALVHLREAARLDPDYVKARRALADIYYREALEEYGDGKYNQAESSVTKAYDYDPDRADILQLWGRTGVKLGQYDGAIELFRRALKKDASLVLERDISDALGLKGESLYSKGQMDDAIRYLESAVEADPANGRANYYLGLCYSRSGAAERAIPHLQKGLKLDPQIVPDTAQAEYHASIATGMKSGKSYDKAVREYLLALAIDPGISVTKQLAECYFWLGRDVQNRGRHKGVVSHLEKAVDLEPDNVEYRLALADELAALGQHEKAVGEYRAVVKLAPDSVENKVQLTKALIRAGLYDEAISRIEKIKKVRPTLPLDEELVEAHFGRAELAERAGEIERAKEDYACVAKAAPERKEAWLRLGQCYEKLGDLPGAMEIYRRFIGDPEIGWQCHYHLGVCLMKMGDRNSAIAYANRHIERGDKLRDAGDFGAAMSEYKLAADIAPDYKGPYHVIAQTYYMQQEYKKGLHYMEKCLDLAPEDPVVLNDLAVLYAKVGRYDDAEGMFHRAIKSKSPYYRACINLSYLYGLMKKNQESIWWAKQAGQVRRGFSQEGEAGFWLR